MKNKFEQQPMALLVALLAVFSSTVNSQPSYYKVTSSLENYLNVRAEPSVDAADVGNLDPGAQPLEIIETDESGNWGRIIWQETTAWVALRFLEPIELPQLADTIVPIGLLCAGTEPFWTIEIESSQNAVLNTPEAATPMSITNVSVSKNRSEDPVAIELFTKDYSAVTVVSRQACSDGLTDIKYNWTADVILQPDLNLLSGCCVTR